jgi:hypothetical protein
MVSTPLLAAWIVAGATGQAIVSGAAGQGVIAVPADHGIVPTISVEYVIPRTALDNIVPRTPINRIITAQCVYPCSSSNGKLASPNIFMSNISTPFVPVRVVMAILDVPILIKLSY